MTKYRAIKTEVDGQRFDSKAEARRYSELRLWEKAGEIKDLRCQRAFVLAPGVKFDGESRAKPPLRYVADFCYQEWRVDRWHTVVEDVKGVQTPLFRAKRHLMKHLFGIDIRIAK
jgi:hypothetical protein